MHIVHGELRKAPYIKSGVGQDGQSTLFIVELAEVIKDRQTGEKVYTNYSAAIFAKSQAQIGYYTSQLVEGNFIVVTGEKLKIDVSPCGKYTKLQIEGARLEGSKYIDGNQLAPQSAPQQQAPQQQYAPQQAPQQMAPQPQQQTMQRQPQQMQQAPTLAQQAAQHPQAQPMQQHSGQAPANFDDDIPF